MLQGQPRISSGEKQMAQIVCAAVLFDLDGVLIDSTDCIRRHWEEWTRQHGLDMESLMRVAHGLRTIETMRNIAI